MNSSSSPSSPPPQPGLPSEPAPEQPAPQPKPKVLVVGGSRGIGRALVNHFQGKSVSRATGHDIRDPAKRTEIASLSLNYDLVINHAFTGDFSQFFMLKELCSLWKEKGKEGWIVHTGSMSSHRFHSGKDEKWRFMAAAKKAADEFIEYVACDAAYQSDVRFRITNIVPGMLDTPKDRQKPHFKAGIDGAAYGRLIEFLLSAPKNLVISKIVAEAKVP